MREEYHWKGYTFSSRAKLLTALFGYYGVGLPFNPSSIRKLSFNTPGVISKLETVLEFFSKDPAKQKAFVYNGFECKTPEVLANRILNELGAAENGPNTRRMLKILLDRQLDVEEVKQLFTPSGEETNITSRGVTYPTKETFLLYLRETYGCSRDMTSNWSSDIPRPTPEQMENYAEFNSGKKGFDFLGKAYKSREEMNIAVAAHYGIKANRVQVALRESWGDLPLALRLLKERKGSTPAAVSWNGKSYESVASFCNSLVFAKKGKLKDTALIQAVRGAYRTGGAENAERYLLHKLAEEKTTEAKEARRQKAFDKKEAAQQRKLQKRFTVFGWCFSTYNTAIRYYTRGEQPTLGAPPDHQDRLDKLTEYVVKQMERGHLLDLSDDMRFPPEIEAALPPGCLPIADVPYQAPTTKVEKMLVRSANGDGYHRDYCEKLYHDRMERARQRRLEHERKQQESRGA